MQSAVTRYGVAWGSAVGLVLAAGVAQGAPHQRKDSGPLFVPVDTGQDAAAVARARVAKGDCAGALPAFDASLRISMDPTVHRDRGLCHEQLGHPFPAIDDYRAYLTAVPEAADAEQIRERLVRLEDSVGEGGSRKTQTGSSPDAEGGASMSMSAGGSASAGGGEASSADSASVSASASASGTTHGGKRGKDYDNEEDNWQKWQAADSSALRLGDGDIFGGYLGVRRMTQLSDVSSYAVGATLRKSLSRVSTLWGEIGYVNYKGSNSLNFFGAFQGATTNIDAGGIGLAIGYEARIRLDQYATSALVLGGGLEFQHINDSLSDVGSSIFLPRVKFGYRLVIGPSFGIELVGDAGQTFTVGTVLIPNTTVYGGTLALTLAF